MRRLCLLLTINWTGCWLTPDQQGERLAQRGEYATAATRFQNPMREGVAWYRAGEFDKAADAFARLSTPEAYFNLGNTWIMLGKYEQAIASYDHALEAQPSWIDAQQNRDLAVARRKLLDATGGELGDQKLGADEIVFDKSKPPGGQDTEVAGDQATSDATVQAIWLRNVQTTPADFLKAKFAYQKAQEADGGAR